MTTPPRRVHARPSLVQHAREPENLYVLKMAAGMAAVGALGVASEGWMGPARGSVIYVLGLALVALSVLMTLGTFWPALFPRRLRQYWEGTLGDAPEPTATPLGRLAVDEEGLELEHAEQPRLRLRWWDNHAIRVVRFPRDETTSEVCIELGTTATGSRVLDPRRFRFLWPAELVDPALPVEQHDDAPWLASTEVLRLADALIETEAVRHGFVLAGFELRVDPERLEQLLQRSASPAAGAALAFLPAPDPAATVDAPMSGSERGHRLRVGTDAVERIAEDGSTARIDLAQPFAAALSRSLDPEGRELLHCELRQQQPGQPWTRLGFTARADVLDAPIAAVPHQPRDFGHLTGEDARAALARIRAAQLDLGDTTWGQPSQHTAATRVEEPEDA